MTAKQRFCVCALYISDADADDLACFLSNYYVDFSICNNYKLQNNHIKQTQSICLYLFLSLSSFLRERSHRHLSAYQPTNQTIKQTNNKQTKHTKFFFSHDPFHDSQMVEAMADSNRVQTFLAVGLFFGILLLSYNYWALSEERTLLSQKVKDSDAKYNDLNEKRSFIEKQIEANTNQIQTMEKKITESGDSLKTKDAEIEALLGKMNQTGLSIDSLLTEMEKVKDQLVWRYAFFFRSLLWLF